MPRLAFKNLVHEKTRLLACVGGVAAALLLVLFLEGVFAASTDQMVAYLEHTDADVWVMQEGVSNMHMATSVLPGDLGRAIEAVPGVADATPILYVSNAVESGTDRWFSYIVGLRAGSPRGGPWALAGSATPGPGEAVIPEVMAEKGGLALGDAVTVLGRGFRVVGLSAGTFSMTNSVTFISYREMEELLAAPGTASYFLVKGRPGVPAEDLARRLREAVPGVHAMTRETFADSDRALTRQMGVDVIRVMSIIGFVVGVLVVGLAVYTATVRRAREYGIARALGAKARHLVALVALQTLAVTLASLAAAVGLALLAQPLVHTLAPEVPLAFPLASVVRVGAMALGIAALASLLPAYRIARVEPGVAFKD